MNYYVDWRKPIKILAFTTLALFVAIGVQYKFGGVDLVVKIMFTLWVLVFAILIGHFSSSLKIENGKVSHLIFGIVKNEYPIEHFSEFKVESGIYPGIIKFKSGKSFCVSGIAIGSNYALARALLEIHEKNNC